MSQTETLTEVSKIMASNDVAKFISILDLGCAQSSYWKNVYSKFKIKMLTGVDIQSEESIKENNKNQSFNETMTEIKAKRDSCLLDFQFFGETKIEKFVNTTPERYDLIVCFCILSILNKEEAQLLISNFRKILNKTGLIALCIPNESRIFYPIKEDIPEYPDYLINKFKLNTTQFNLFVQEYNIKYHEQYDQYHWAILSCI